MVSRRDLGTSNLSRSTSFSSLTLSPSKAPDDDGLKNNSPSKAPVAGDDKATVFFGEKVMKLKSDYEPHDTNLLSFGTKGDYVKDEKTGEIVTAKLNFPKVIDLKRFGWDGQLQKDGSGLVDKVPAD